jgi:hypothetical protein
MNKNKIALSSLAMDLKRAALGYRNGSGSLATASRFLEEALVRRSEIDKNQIKPHVKKLMTALDKIMEEKDIQKRAEDALMYSTLFQNAALK